MASHFLPLVLVIGLLASCRPEHGEDEPPRVAGGPLVEGTWDAVPLDRSIHLRDIAFFDDLTGIAVGGPSVILRTTDGGASWGRAMGPDPGGHAWDRILVTGLKEAWIVVHVWGAAVDVVARTLDAGATWQRLGRPQLSLPEGAMLSAARAGTLLCIVGTREGVRTWHTGPEEGRWKAVQDLPSALASASAFHFADSTAGVSVLPIPGGVGVWSTGDGGEIWAEQARIDGVIGPAYHLAFADPRTGWLAGSYGPLHATTDGGRTWKRQWFESAEFGHRDPDPQVDVHVASPRRVHVLCGHEHGAAVYRSEDGGTTWRQLPILHPPGSVRGLWFPSAASGWVAGERGFLARFSASD